LVAVPAERVAAALASAGGGNPLLRFAEPPPARPGPDFSGLVDAVAGWLGPVCTERRVAGSLAVLGYAARLLGPTVAVLLRCQLLVDARPATVRWSFAPQTGFQLGLAEVAGWHGPPAELADRWCADVLDDHLAAVVAAVRAQVPVAAGLLWGNVASGLVGTLGALLPLGVELRDALAFGERALAHGPLRGSGTLTVRDGRPAFRRRSCCLYYRLPGGGLCADCCLRSEPGR
jgi:ferric iron reductase protein FhuF